MTSAEFSAKYLVLKTLTEQGARSQIAQEGALGRIVMVHHLDVGSAVDRQRLRAGVGALDAAAAEKVFGVVDVDGTTVVVTHFLVTFTDFPTWVRDNANVEGAQVKAAISSSPSAPLAPPHVSRPADPSTPRPTELSESSITAMFGAGGVAPMAQASPQDVQVGSPASRGAAPPPHPPEGSRPVPGAFTEMFGAVRTPVAPPPPAFRPAEQESPPVSRPAVPPAAPARPSSQAAEPPAIPGASFTQLFGKIGASSSGASPAPPAFGGFPPPPLSPAAARFDAVLPPSAPLRPPAAPPSALPSKPASGNFTQLFARLETPGSMPALPPEPTAPLAYTPATPPLMTGPLAPSWQATQATPATPSPQVLPPVAPPPPSAPASGGPSEFTRILGRVVPPPATPLHTPAAPQAPVPATLLPQFQLPQTQVPQMQVPQMQVPQTQVPHVQVPQMQLPPMQLPPVQSAFAAIANPAVAPTQAPTPPKQVKSFLPLIIALNVLLISGIGAVLYFVLKR